MRITWVTATVGALHALFAFCELLPWSEPVLLRAVGKRLPAGEQSSASGHRAAGAHAHRRVRARVSATGSPSTAPAE